VTGLDPETWETTNPNRLKQIEERTKRQSDVALVRERLKVAERDYKEKYGREN